MNNIIDFITQNKLGKYRVTPDQIELGCPNKKCANAGQQQFYINKETGAFFCHRCGWKGNSIKALAYKLGIISLTQPVETEHIFFSPKEIEEMQDSLWKSNEALDYLTLKRGFKEETIEQFRLGLKEFDGHPVITIPFFDKTDACVGLKYYFYTRPAGTSKMRFEKGSKIQAFNLNLINAKSPLVVTEGEFDAMSAWQYGYTNVISIPNGANGINGWTKEIEGFDKYLLCFDNDKAGQEGAIKFAEVVGKARCYRVYPRLKDLNDYLQHEIGKPEVDAIFADLKPMFEAPITDITNYLDGAIQSLSSPEQTKGISTGWKSIDYYLGGIRESEVTVTSGITGHGKTTFALALISNLLEKNVNSLIISPEMPEQDLLLSLARNHFRKQFTPKDAKEIQTFVNGIHGKVNIANVYNQWTGKSGERTIDHIFDLIDYSVRHHKTKFILIDHLRFFITPKEQESERFCIDQFMQKCVHTAIHSKCHIWLVVQPKNLPANQKKITMMDLKGSSNIGQDAHNVVLVHRYSDPKKERWVEIDIAKNRKFGLCGSIPLEFDLKSMSNYYEVKE